MSVDAEPEHRRGGPMTMHRTRIPDVGYRARTFGGEFEVVSKTDRVAEIRWIDDDTTTRMEVEVLELMLASYAMAATAKRTETAVDEVAFEPVLPDWMLDSLVAEQQQQEGTHAACWNCGSHQQREHACWMCGHLECTDCAACPCLITADVETGQPMPVC
jgi:hypothetical protein